MRLTSEYSVACPCGATVEWPDSINWQICWKCGRHLVVAAFPNQPPITVAPEVL